MGGCLSSPAPKAPSIKHQAGAAGGLVSSDVVPVGPAGEPTSAREAPYKVADPPASAQQLQADSKASEAEMAFADPSADPQGSSPATETSEDAKASRSTPEPLPSIPPVTEDTVAEPVLAVACEKDPLRSSPGCFSHSLKLLHSNTLNSHNIQLCRPQELVGDIKDMAFIGNGSFAAVFKGSWQGAKVAIKFVVSDSLSNNSVGLRESVLSQLLSHPNVIQTYTTRCAIMDDASLQAIHADIEGARSRPLDLMKKGFVSGDGFGDPRQQVVNTPVTFSKILLQLQVKPGQFVAVVIMEYADKGTLQDAIYKRQIFKESPRWNKRIAARALFRTAREIAIGMQHLHNSNVLHGDLKPGNVLLVSSRVDRRGFSAKLTDFGLSHVAAGSIATNTWGTLRYMAPEHFQGTMSRATDVYAFGMLLWEMVSGKKPYEDMHQGEIIQCVSQGLRPVWPPDCFPHLEYLGKRCLAHNPDERPSFTEIVKEIEDMEVMLRDLLQQAREGTVQAPHGPSSNNGSFTNKNSQDL